VKAFSFAFNLLFFFLNSVEHYSIFSTLSTITAARRKLSGLRTAASIIHREARSACLKPRFVRREPQLNHPNSNWN
jgi:hypothetical protein